MTAATANANVPSRLHQWYRLLLLPGFALLLLVAAWSAVILLVSQERDAAERQGVLRAQALARTLADHAGNLLRQGEHATQLFKLQYEGSSGALRLAAFVRKGGLMDGLLDERRALPIALLGPDGAVLDSRHGYPAGSAAALGFFAGHQNDAVDRAHVGSLAADGGGWRISVSRRLNDGRGRFAGVLVILVDPALFLDDYPGLNLGPDDLLLLSDRASGLSLGRAGAVALRDLRLAFLRGDDPGAPEEIVPATPPDAVARLYSFHQLPRYPLLAVVGLGQRGVLAGFERERRVYFSLLVLASAVIVVFVALLMQQSQRLRHSQHATSVAQARQRAAAHASLDAIYLLDAWRAPGGGGVEDFVFADVNQRGADMLGLPRDGILGHKVSRFLSAGRQRGGVGAYLRVLESGRPAEEEFEIAPDADGAPRWLYHQIVPLPDGVAVTTRDITARRRADLAMRSHQAELAAVNDASPLGLLRADRDGACTYVNRSFEAITGLRRDAALGDGWMAALHPDDRALLLPALEHLTRTQAPYQASLRLLHRDGKLLWVAVKIAPILVDGAIAGFVGTLDDITTLRLSELALKDSAARLRTMADTLPAMIAYIDAEEVYRFHNLAYEREFGQLGLQVQGRSVRQTVGEARYRFLQPYIARVLAGETLRFEEEDGDFGAPRTLEVNYIPQRGDDAGTVAGFHVMRQDITVQKREKQRLLKLAQLDTLTGLANRAGFLQKLSDSMLASRANGHTMALMYMDIDRFKPVNDTYGHSVGDALLRAFAQRLSHTMRSTDTIARLGGDEFTIIVEKLARRDDATVLAANIVAAMRAPFELDGVTVTVSASIGLAWYRDAASSPAELLKQADVLLYRAKQDGRDTYRAAA